MEEADEVLAFIRQIALQINLLGLKVSIGVDETEQITATIGELGSVVK